MEIENPFLGPKSYEEEDKEKFFGRNKEIKEIINLVRNETLTLLFSRSGTGKSSIIKAGLIPLLRNNCEYIPVYIHLNDSGVNANSTDNLCDYVIKRCKEEINKHLSGKENIKLFIPDLQYGHSLFEFVITSRLLLVEDSEFEYIIKPVIIFDQFEEIFTHAFVKADLESLIRELSCLVESRLPDYISNAPKENIIKIQNSLISKQKNFKILFSFREEYLPQFESLRTEIPFIQFTNSRYRLEAFSKTTAVSVITETDNKISKTIAEQIVENLAINISPNFEKIIVEPFLLSLVCQEIYYEIIDEKNEFGTNTIEKIKKIVNNSIDQYIKDVYANISENTKAFIETKLITSDHKRTPFNYNEAIAIPKLKADINKLIDDPETRLLNKEEFLDSPHIEILHDRLLPPLAKLRDQRLRKTENKKRNRILLLSLFAVTIIVGICLLFISKQKRDLEQMGMFNTANQYFEQNDLRKAYGIYSRLGYKDISFIKKFVNSKSNDLTYTDLPGTNSIVLSNNHIITTLDSSTFTTFEIWEVISATRIRLLKTYKKVSLYAISTDGNYVAIYNKENLTLYNAKTNTDTVLLKDSRKGIYFEFSQNSRYIYYTYPQSKFYFFDLKKQTQSYSCNVDTASRGLLRDIAFISPNNIYNSVYLNDSFNYFIKWNKINDTLTYNYNDLIISGKTPWCYMQNDSLLLITSKGIEVKNLGTDQQTLLLGGDFRRFQFIRKISPNSIILYSKYLNKRDRKYDNEKYTALGFLTLGKNDIYEPFKNKLIDKISISLNWERCLVRNNQDIFLIDYKKATTSQIEISQNSLSKTFLKDTIYDISDNGRYLLYVKLDVNKAPGKPELKRMSLKGKNSADKSDTSATLYLCDLSKRKSTEIDKLAPDPNQINDVNESIYGKYFFRFNPISDKFAYLKKGKNGNSSLIVRALQDTGIVYKSSVPQNYIDDFRQLDFSSFYIHVKNADTLNTSREGIKPINARGNSDKRGIKLLNDEVRNTQYFFKLYPRMGSEEWNSEVERLNKH